MKDIIIPKDQIKDTVSALVQKANRVLPQDVRAAIEGALKREKRGSPRRLLEILLENAFLAEKHSIPICQDTGIDCVFVELGQEVRISGDLNEAIQEGIRSGTEKGHLRASVADPLTRKNTGDNTPGVIHVEIVAGERFSISVLPKGCGSENMSTIFMLPPSAGTRGIVQKVVEQVRLAGPNACPPGVIGVGIGGTMEKAAFMAKKALLRPIGSHHSRNDVRAMEEELLTRINALGIGPLGLGGVTTALWVSAEVYPCHIASLPVAVNYQCHAARRAMAVLKDGRLEIRQ